MLINNPVILLTIRWLEFITRRPNLQLVDLVVHVKQIWKRKLKFYVEKKWWLNKYKEWNIYKPLCLQLSLWYAVASSCPDPELLNFFHARLN